MDFQSYLITGSASARRKRTKDLLAKSKINLDKVSPDIAIVTPPKKDVTIDQVREIRTTVFQKPVSLPYKIVIIENAEKLNLPAQNALLKILEEPPKSAVIILEARDKSQILPTILSRVVTIATEREKRKEIKSILLDSKNPLTLLKAIAQVEDPNAWLDDQILALYNLLKSARASVTHPKGVLALHLRSSEKKLSVEEITSAIEACARAKEMLDANVNPKHVLTNLVLNIQLSP